MDKKKTCALQGFFCLQAGSGKFIIITIIAITIIVIIIIIIIINVINLCKASSTCRLVVERSPLLSARAAHLFILRTMTFVLLIRFDKNYQVA